MMRLALALMTFLLAPTASAVHLIVQDPCSNAAWLDATAVGDAGDTVGYATVATFERDALPFVGTESGINSIKDTVTGNAAIEVISDREMRAYGWCYSVNGVEPDVLPDGFRLTGSADVVRWYFGYAHYLDGEWLTYCTPTHLSRPDYICAR